MIFVPMLDHDKMMFRKYGRAVSPAGRLERRIVAALCAHLAREGFDVYSVWDGEAETAVASTKDAMELIFNLDEAVLYFRKGKFKRSVYLVLGNGEEIISDWRSGEGDPDGFDAAMEALRTARAN